MVAGSEEKDATSFEAVLGRLKEASNTFSDTEFAQKALGKRQSAVSNAKERGGIPPLWVKIVAEKYNVSADWLFFGIGEMNNPGLKATFSDSEKLSVPGSRGKHHKTIEYLSHLLALKDEGNSHSAEELDDLREQLITAMIIENSRLKEENEGLRKENSQLRTDVIKFHEMNMKMLDEFSKLRRQEESKDEPNDNSSKGLQETA